MYKQYCGLSFALAFKNGVLVGIRPSLASRTHHDSKTPYTPSCAGNGFHSYPFPEVSFRAVYLVRMRSWTVVTRSTPERRLRTPKTVWRPLQDLRNTPRDGLCTRNIGRRGNFTVRTSPRWRLPGSSEGPAFKLRKDGGDGVPFDAVLNTRLGGAGLVVNPRKLIRRGYTGEDGSGVNSGFSHVKYLARIDGNPTAPLW